MGKQGNRRLKSEMVRRTCIGSRPNMSKKSVRVSLTLHLSETL